MTLMLLLDLDETLLSLQIDAFLKAYLSALGSHLKSKFDPSLLIQNLLDATRQMAKNDRPERTLEEVFSDAFFPALSTARQNIEPDILDFYQNVYPSLKKLTQPNDPAIRAIHWAFEKGYRLAVATNPLFPATAIHQRLAWAEIDSPDFPFTLVSSYETFHFAKPNPAFFMEVLAQMGWPEGSVVMVGNSADDDISPAAKLGLPTYQISAEPGGLNGDILHVRGRFEDLPAWLEHIEQSGPQPIATTPIALLACLKAVPAALLTLSRALQPEEWHSKPQADEWNLTEIACHLRDVEKEVDLPRVHQILTENNPFLPGIVTDIWATERDYDHQNGAQALKDFTRSRIELIDRLSPIAPSDWDRPARHAIFGPTTLREVVSFIVAHDRDHLRQSFRTIQAIPTRLAQ